MNKQHSLSIRTSIMVLIAVLTIVPSGLIIYSAMQQRNHDYQVAMQLAEGLSNEVSSEQKVLVSGAEQLLNCLAYIPFVQNRDAKATSALLAELVNKNKTLTDIIVADTSGLVWASAHPLQKTILSNDRRYFKNVMATGNFSSGEYTHGRIMNKPVFGFGYPIKDSSGKIRDIAIIAFNLTNYDQLLKLKKLTASTSLVLTDHKGTILFDPHNPAFIGKQDKDEIFKRMVEGPDKGEFNAIGNTGQNRYFSYIKVYLNKEQTPYMYVRAGIQKQEIEKIARNDIISKIGIMVFMTLLAFGFAIFFSKRGIVDKITALRDAAQRVAHGDLDIHVSEYVSGGELGELGNAFDVMAHKLANDIADRKRAEEERQEDLFFIETLLENAPIGIRVFDGETGKCLLLNKATADIAGGKLEAMQNQNFRELVSWRRSGLLEVAEAVLADGSSRTVGVDMLTSFGKQASVSYIVSRFIVKGISHLLVIGRDIAIEKQLADKNRKMEVQMLHVQKLESLGVLAGGIAHDFNNLLQTIIGNAELSLMRIAPESRARDNLLQIEKSAQRAADLAQQMLAYSGKGRFVIERLDINSLITEMTSMLEVSISKKSQMHLNLGKNLPLFAGDATQVRQIIMNLVINASEAIGEEGGDITITTGSVDCSQTYLSRIWQLNTLEEGTYIFFEIADTGCGMDQETLAKIFDPFFTTKFTGRGLGMAAVIGIVRGHLGAITVDSKPGKGTIFKVFFPAKHNYSVISPKESTQILPSISSGTIMMVDDEKTILKLGKDMLEELGYSVLTAENGVVALDLFKNHKAETACVILDLTMPRLDGEQTFRELQLIDPNVQVIMSSGYNEQEITQKFVGKGLAGFIQKPYVLAELSRKLREVVGER